MATKSESRDFAMTMTDAAVSLDQWLAIVKFGLPTMLADPPLLIEVLVAAADKFQRMGAIPDDDGTPGAVSALMGHLGLRFTTNTD